MLTRTTDTEPITIYKGNVEPSKEVMDSLRNQSLKNNPPPAEPGYKWVWHHNHWDKVKISEQNETPVIANDVPKKSQQHISSSASSETIRQQNQRYMEMYRDDIEGGEPLYNFYKEHPDFDSETSSPELYDKWIQAFLQTRANMRTYRDKLLNHKAELDKRISSEPTIFGPVRNYAGGEE